MTNYVLVYKGGGMPQTDAEREAVTGAWNAWYAALGQAVVDGGNPFGPAKTVAPGGTVSDGAASRLSGYTILQADSLAAAAQLAKDCPVVSGGGSVEVYETFQVT